MKFSKWVTYRISALATVYWCFPVWFRTGLWPKAVTFPADTFDLNDWASLDNLLLRIQSYPSPGPWATPKQPEKFINPVASPPRLYCLTADLWASPPHIFRSAKHACVTRDGLYRSFLKNVVFQRQVHWASSQGLSGEGYDHSLCDEPL